MWHRIRVALLVAIAIALGIQFVPYGRDHANPPVRREPAWNNPQTRQLAVRACYDCHSNQTVWPWYTNVAPLSWLAQRDVDQGRQELNFSEWDRPPREIGEVAGSVQRGQMPPSSYTLIQSKARLSSLETQALTQGLQATLGGTGSQGGGYGD